MSADKQKLTFSIIVRSLIFNFFFYSFITLGVLFWLFPTSFFKSPEPMRNAIGKMIDIIITAYEKIANIKIIERGIENIPVGKSFIFCSKHMSNMDALFLYRRSPNLTALAKKELFRVPCLNYVFKKMKVPAINRGASEAQKQTADIVKTLIQNKMPLIIFAEGTRTVVGERRKLKSGTFYFQEEADLDVIVVAHNAGVCWPKKSWIKWPGELIVEYSEPMPKGLDKESFMQEIEHRLLDRSEELML
ncbi:lysophospholipid acyltransferase family protein [Pseudemcibacter aquimaris]|uniref:lysophospholipid acyltransferase family protein n=1 Tax=Pseudemcibacter aquimaris TaxID=2857064 RepID=UPI002011C04F|nr:lysophospholipid acyltransferase family protein [Pseudemcibacter aquimaris]MCC3861931.1 1-acyl-sn-glycerol-3-phosphate acyltransferase [Pseudemcibacter aquimaris]WDU58683.1 1-acyl-sn-glycerol-3-phosphate acyltransferase [Pseudemcibacter aquimaris]